MNEDFLGVALGLLIVAGTIVFALAVTIAWSAFVGWLVVFVAGIFFTIPPMTFWHYLAIGIVISWFMPKPAVIQQRK
jgi:hypothetical protein